MSLEIPSACARLPFCVSRLHVCEGPAPSEGATCLLLLRETMWSVPVWSGLGQAGVGWGGEPAAPGGCGHGPLCLAAACPLGSGLCASLGVSTEQSQPGELWGRARVWAHPGNASSWVQRAGEEGAGAHGTGEPPGPCLGPSKGNREMEPGDRQPGLWGRTLAAAFRVLPGAPWVGWVCSQGTGRGAWE